MKTLCCHFPPRSCDSAYHGSLCLRVAVHSGKQQAVLCALGEISCGRQFNCDWRLCRRAIAWYIKLFFFIISWAFNFVSSCFKCCDSVEKDWRSTSCWDGAGQKSPDALSASHLLTRWDASGSLAFTRWHGCAVLRAVAPCVCACARASESIHLMCLCTKVSHTDPTYFHPYWIWSSPETS